MPIPSSLCLLPSYLNLKISDLRVCASAPMPTYHTLLPHPCQDRLLILWDPRLKSTLLQVALLRVFYPSDRKTVNTSSTNTEQRPLSIKTWGKSLPVDTNVHPCDVETANSFPLCNIPVIFCLCFLCSPPLVPEAILNAKRGKASHKLTQCLPSSCLSCCRSQLEPK